MRSLSSLLKAMAALAALFLGVYGLVNAVAVAHGWQQRREVAGEPWCVQTLGAFGDAPQD
ncbi:MAG TPA: hypothetical protein VFY76_10400 [Nocardioides sp.]|nr:hypothetical protein [Nocardioides sp.]